MHLQDEQNWTRDISKQGLLKLTGSIFISFLHWCEKEKQKHK